jgi:hypothetical protein
LTREELVDRGVIQYKAATAGLFLLFLWIVPAVLHGDGPLALPAKHDVLSPNKKIRAEFDPHSGTRLNLIPLDYPKDLVLITFWNDGHKIREIRIGEIFPDERLLKRTASHYDWGYITGIAHDGFLHVKRSDGLEIYYDVKTGNRRERVSQ